MGENSSRKIKKKLNTVIAKSEKEDRVCGAWVKAMKAYWLHFFLKSINLNSTSTLVTNLFDIR